MNKFEEARQKYKPANIKCLFIAEAPPKLDSNRFFYFEKVNKQDSLFLEMMKCLYPYQTENTDAKLIRENKVFFLNRFKDDGYYLIDSLDRPFEVKYTIRQKESLIRHGQNDLLNKIKFLISKDTRVILISASVFKANFLFLRSHSINVINEELIDFPGSGGQKNFKMKVSSLLNNS